MGSFPEMHNEPLVHTRGQTTGGRGGGQNFGFDQRLIFFNPCTNKCLNQKWPLMRDGHL